MKNKTKSLELYICEPKKTYNLYFFASSLNVCNMKPFFYKRHNLCSDFFAKRKITTNLLLCKHTCGRNMLKGFSFFSIEWERKKADRTSEYTSVYFIGFSNQIQVNQHNHVAACSCKD